MWAHSVMQMETAPAGSVNSFSDAMRLETKKICWKRTGRTGALTCWTCFALQPVSSTEGTDRCGATWTQQLQPKLSARSSPCYTASVRAEEDSRIAPFSKTNALLFLQTSGVRRVSVWWGFEEFSGRCGGERKFEEGLHWLLQARQSAWARSQ